MTETDLQRQLEELKRQVASLAAERASSTEPAMATAGDAGPDPDADPETEVRTNPFDQAEELIGLLEKELRESPVVSGLAIFAAGVLVGRLLR